MAERERIAQILYAAHYPGDPLAWWRTSEEDRALHRRMADAVRSQGHCEQHSMSQPERAPASPRDTRPGLELYLSILREAMAAGEPRTLSEVFADRLDAVLAAREGAEVAGQQTGPMGSWLAQKAEIARLRAQLATVTALYESARKALALSSTERELQLEAQLAAASERERALEARRDEMIAAHARMNRELSDEALRFMGERDDLRAALGEAVAAYERECISDDTSRRWRALIATATERSAS